MIIQSRAEAERVAHELRRWSFLTGLPAGLDTEFENAGDWSPIGRAKLFLTQIAWGPPPEKHPGEYEAVVIPTEHLEPFRVWLQDPGAPKVGSSILGVDRHVLANEDINVGGIVGCTWLMSKLLDPSTRLPDGGSHGLKAWAERIGWDTSGEFSDLPLSRPKPGKVKAYKRDRLVQEWVQDVQDGVCVTQVPTIYVAGAEVQGVSFKTQQKLTLSEAWKEPRRRAKIAEYALKDPCMSLDVYWHLRRKLEELGW